jgi:hypothetical protein
VVARRRSTGSEIPVERAGVDVDLVAAAVVSHHAKAAPTGDWAWCQPKGRPRFALHLDDPQVSAVLRRAAADAAASGLSRTDEPLTSWIDDRARGATLTGAVAREVVAPRTRQLARRAPFRWHAFQDLAARKGRRVLMVAPCGAGKTLAAWRWAQAASCRRSPTPR